MLNYHVKIGLVPIRRDVTPRPGIFNWEKAEERCAAAVAYIEEHFTSENVSYRALSGGEGGRGIPDQRQFRQ